MKNSLFTLSNAKRIEFTSTCMWSLTNLGLWGAGVCLHKKPYIMINTVHAVHTWIIKFTAYNSKVDESSL